MGDIISQLPAEAGPIMGAIVQYWDIVSRWMLVAALAVLLGCVSVLIGIWLGLNDE